MNNVRLYGRTLGESSHVQVTRGFELALRDMLAGIVALDHQALDDDEDIPLPGGAEAKHAVFTGPLNMVDIMHKNVRHERRWAMVAPNSNRLPDRLLAQLCGACDVLMAPSEWARLVIEQEIRRCWEAAKAASWQSAPTTTTLTVPHGVHPDFALQADQRALRAQEFLHGNKFRVLHMSTSDRQRKGTVQLVQAWSLLEKKRLLPGNAQLVLALDAGAMTSFRVWAADDEIDLPSSMTTVGRMNLPPADMGKWLAQFHVVCQPSRGEGFGLCPLESRVCGVPIVVTGCTGHSEWAPKPPEGLAVGAAYVAQGCVVIAHGEDEPIDDLPGALAPGVTAESVAQGLEASVDNWAALNEESSAFAADVKRDWAWEKVLGALRERLV